MAAIALCFTTLSKGPKTHNRYVFEVQLLIGGIILGDGFVMSFHGQHDVRIEALACIGSGGGEYDPLSAVAS